MVIVLNKNLHFCIPIMVACAERNTMAYMISFHGTECQEEDRKESGVAS